MLKIKKYKYPIKHHLHNTVHNQCALETYLINPRKMSVCSPEQQTFASFQAKFLPNFIWYLKRSFISKSSFVTFVS